MSKTITIDEAKEPLREGLINYRDSRAIVALLDSLSAVEAAEPQITFDTSKSRYLLTLAGRTWDITQGMQQIINKETRLLKDIIRVDMLEDTEWLAQYGIEYNCGWRDAIDKLIAEAQEENDLLKHSNVAIYADGNLTINGTISLVAAHEHTPTVDQNGLKMCETCGRYLDEEARTADLIDKEGPE